MASSFFIFHCKRQDECVYQQSNLLYCRSLPSVPDKPNCIEVRRCPDGGNCTASSKCRCPMPKRTEFWECRCPDMPSTQLHASQLGHEIIPSNADHHPVPLQRRPWSRIAVAPDVDLFHASYHVFVLVARGSPRIEACVVVVRKGMELWNQLVQFPLPH